MPTTLWLLVLTAAAAFVGAATVVSPVLGAAIAAAAALVIVVTRQPDLLALLIVPGSLVLFRVGGAVTATEVLTVVAAALAVPLLLREPIPRPLAIGLASGVAYQVLLMTAVVAHPSAAAFLEWGHRGTIVLGGILVGAWLGRTGRLGLAVTLLAVGVAVLGAVAVVQTFTSGFEPAYPLGFHKNFVGSLSATCLLVLIVVRSEIPLRRWAWWTVVALLGAGLVACQSRGGLIALATGLVVWSVAGRMHGRSKRAKVGLVVAAAAAAVAIQSVISELDPRQFDEFSSSAVRSQVQTETIALWLTNPWTGVGLVYEANPLYRTRALDNGALNAALQALAEGGLLSLAALLILVLGTTYALYNGRGTLAAAGLAVLWGRLAHGMVDHYWTASTSTVTWVVVGAGLVSAAAAAGTRADQSVSSEGHRARAES